MCVDLDGTLLRGDMLHESACELARSRPWLLPSALVRLIKGRAALKAHLGELTALDVAVLPFNDAVVAMVRDARAKGRRTVLVTATTEKLARQVAEHLGCFDEVIASDRSTNLRGDVKAARLVERFGEGGFDYAGNSRDDVPVWDVAEAAFVAAPDRTATRYLASSPRAELVLEEARSTLSLWIKTLRLHQWLKNSLLFVPLVLAGLILDPAAWTATLAAFYAFGFLASSVYVLNDLLDMPADRRHPSKRNRPIAAGLVGVPQALLACVACFSIAVAIAAFLPPAFALVLAIYYISTLAYSFVLKRKMLVDAVTLAGLFTLRVFAGAAALDLAVSNWLLGFSSFFFLSLALVKRYVELDATDLPEGRKVAGRGYRAEDLPILSQAGLSSGFAATVVLALFVDQAEMRSSYSSPDLVWLVCPLVLYMITRIWMLARRGEMHDDPVIFILTDWRSQVVVAAGVFVLLAAKIV